MSLTNRLNPGLSNSNDSANFWPGFVDALSSVSLVLVFALIVFVVGQTHLSVRVTNQEKELNHTSQALKKANTNAQNLWAQLARANYSTQAMKGALRASLDREADLAEELRSLRESLSSLQQTDQTKTGIISSLEEAVASLTQSNETLKDHNQSLELKYAEVKSLVAMAQKRSDFLMQVSEGLKGMEGIRQHGDRFVFDSNLLFRTASARLTPQGLKKIEDLAVIVKKIFAQLPENVSWVVRIDGHTDAVPIRNTQFKSNWELSFARAMSVLNTLVAKGIPAKRLAAAGFGEHHPVSNTKNHAENRRIEIRLDSF